MTTPADLDSETDVGPAIDPHLDVDSDAGSDVDSDACVEQNTFPQENERADSEVPRCENARIESNVAAANSSRRTDLMLLIVGVVILFWKMHGFKLPSQIAAEQLQRTNDVRAQMKQKLLPGTKQYFLDSLGEWLQPWRWGRGDLLKPTTPTGGDFGAHVWLPDFVKRSLLPKGRLTGWSNDFFGGYPALGFYFPLPLLAIAFLSFVLPYGIAFKLISVLGICSLPLVSYHSGSIAGLSRPVPLFMGLGAFIMLLGRQYDLFIYGGGILPTMAGEFSFSISLSIGVWFLGSFARLMRKGIGKRKTALLLACTGLSHLLPTLWVLIVAGILLTIHLMVIPRNGNSRKTARRSLIKRASFVFVVAGMLAGWWLVPFAANLDYTNDMGWEKSTRYVEFLFPFLAKRPPADSQLMAFAFAFAVFGLVSACVRLFRRNSAVDTQIATGNGAVPFAQDRSGVQFIAALGTVTILAGLLFRFSPQYRLWNARILPFWFLSILFLAAYGVASFPRIRLSTKVFVTTLSVLIGVGLPLRLLPGWLPIPRFSDGLVGVQQARRSTDTNIMVSWTKHNFSGYESQPAWPEYRSLMTEASRVGREEGCGTAMWEHEEVRFNTYGTTLALMLFPYWTKGCIGSLDGIYFESSATLPQHWISAGLVSAPKKTNEAGTVLYSGFTEPQRNLIYPKFNLARGIGLLRNGGVRFFIAVTPETIQLADAMTNDLRPVGRSGPYVFYRIVGSEVVRALSEEPVVVTGIDGSQDGGWLDTEMELLRTPDLYPNTVTASGPKAWQRIKSVIRKPPGVRTYGAGTTITRSIRRSLPHVAITGIRRTNVSIDFDVDRVDIPVTVNVSYFPNWKATGAKGPIRSMPNYMVVIPTRKHVHISYGYSSADRVGWLLTIVGVVVLCFPAAFSVVSRWRRDRRPNPAARR